MWIEASERNDEGIGEEFFLPGIGERVEPRAGGVEVALHPSANGSGKAGLLVTPVGFTAEGNGGLGIKIRPARDQQNHKFLVRGALGFFDLFSGLREIRRVEIADDLAEADAAFERVGVRERGADGGGRGWGIRASK